jgi:RHS repeat-associated protein
METAASHEVTLADSLDRTNRFTVDRSPNRDSRRAITFGDGTVAHVDSGADQRETNRLVSGAALAFNKGPDPRFGMLAPVPQTETVTLPSGLTSTSGTTRTAVLATPGTPLSLVAFTQTNTINGRAYTCAYEASNRVVTVTTPQGRQTVMRLDAAGRIIRQESVGLEPMQFTYDARGRLTEVAAGTGASARVARAEYSAAGFLDAAADSAGRTTRFEYDAAGRVLAKVLPDGARIGFAYDAQGNLAVVRPPGRPDHVFAYNPVDLQTNYLPPSVDGATKPIQSVYDAARQLTEVTLPDDQRVSSSHDSAGRLTALSTPEGEYRYAYSASGALASIAAPSGINLAYGSDGSLLTSTVWSGAVTGAVTKVFDSNFWVSSVRINGEPPTPFSYDRDGFTTNAGSLLIERHPQHGQVTAATLGAVATTKQYNDFGELTGQTASFGASTLLAESYARDALGRITTKAETLDGATNTCDYAYDVGGRLAGVKKNGNTISAYTYDGNGNRLSHTDRDGAVVPGTYDDQDRLLQYGDAVYGYGANGDLSSKTVVGQTTTYRHDVFGNLLAVRLPDGAEIEYLMDGRNRRVGKKVGGTLVQGFLYLNALCPVAELDGDSRVVSVFVYGSRFNTPDCLIKSGVAYRIVADHLGSPRRVVNTETGAIVQRLDYDEFGRVLLDTNPGFQPFGFAGGLYDPATGLTRYGARDYDAETGRWTTKDPLLFAGLDGNLYRYAGGDPVNLADLTGLGAELFAAAMPDYLTFNVGYGPGSFSVTLDRYCRFYLGGGVSGAPTKLSVNANLSGGYLMGARAQSEDTPTPQQLSQFLTGHCVGGSLYSLFGGGIQHSPGGDTSLEFGVGLGGSIGDSYSVTPQEVADYAQQTGDHLGRLQMNLRHDSDMDASTYSGFGSFK